MLERLFQLKAHNTNVRTSIDGVETFWAPCEGPLRCVLSFRNGMADETYLTAGISHVVEHLALFGLEDASRHNNGYVDATTTVFHTQGSADEVATFLTRLTAQLSHLPLQRLEQERSVLAAEAAMRAGTGGVNTHRGALFSLGLLLAAQGAAATERSTASSVPAAALGRAAVLGSPEHLALKLGPASLGEVCARVAGLAAPLLERWRETALDEPVDPSHGAAALRDLGVTGARGEAVSGFATALDVGLPAYRDRLAAHGDPDDAARWALVRLIAVNADTNLVARGGATGLDFARAWATGVAERAPGPVALVNELAAADAEFTRRNLSPGGSADLLALTWLLRSRPEA